MVESIYQKNTAEKNRKPPQSERDPINHYWPD